METAIESSEGKDVELQGAPPACPVHRATLAPLVITDRLFVPHRKRLVSAYDATPDGGRELRINYGIKEITFDDERFFAFGEQILLSESFTGEQAVTWGPGYAWDELQPLLESLIEDKVLARGERVPDPRGTGLVPSKLPPAPCARPRMWSLADCEAITLELGGRAVELGNLEAVVPSYRIPHPALDHDDRQVGEANVFPPGLRMDRETEWRVCQYPGSRFRDDTPMNVTALKAMIKHWKPMMAVIRATRDSFQARLGLARDRWSVGELHVFGSVVCALPAFVLLRGGGASPQVPLHPVLSSMFRVTDGVRMAMHEMLFDTEATRATDEPMTATEVYDHVERNNSLMGSTTGVCAGPRHMIEEYLAAVIDGVDLARYDGVDQPPEVQALLDQLPDAIDYGLHGMQTWGLALAVWIAHSKAYEAVLGVLESAGYHDACGKLRTRLRTDWNRLGVMQMSLDHDRNVHLVPYIDAYEVAWRALRAPVGVPVHADEIAVGPHGAAHDAVARQLRAVLIERLAGSELVAGDAPAIARLVEILVAYLREEQAVLAAATANQEAINALLGRPRPARPLAVRDIRAVYTMTAGPGSYPYLFDSLDAELGLWVEASEHAIDVIDRRAS